MKEFRNRIFRDIGFFLIFIGLGLVYNVANVEDFGPVIKSFLSAGIGVGIGLVIAKMWTTRETKG